MNIVERILKARQAHLQVGGPLKGLVCKLPTADYEDWGAWIFKIENDPILGYTPTGLNEHAFGMDIALDRNATQIEVSHANH